MRWKKTFTKVRSIKDIIISAILVVSGVLLLVFPTGIIKSGEMAAVGFITGVVGIVLAYLMLVMTGF